MKIYIKTTEACNLKCKHCYIGDNRRFKQQFDADKTIGWLKNYIAQYGIKESSLYISFHGGEPFLGDLREMQKVCDAFPTAQFDATSNLAMDIEHGIKDFILKNFQQEGVGPFVKTSWDYDIRFSNEAQEAIWMRNVKSLIEAGVAVKVITCLTKPFLENVAPEEYLLLMKSLGVKHTSFERLTSNTTEDKSLIPPIEQVDEWLLKLYEINDCLENSFFSDIATACKHNFIGCRKRECMSSVLTINANGTIGGCPNSSIKNWFFNLDGYKNTERRKELIMNESVRNPGCYACELYQECNGDCHQLEWINGKCYVPKKLFQKIKDDVAAGSCRVEENWL